MTHRYCVARNPKLEGSVYHMFNLRSRPDLDGWELAWQGDDLEDGLLQCDAANRKLIGLKKNVPMAERSGKHDY